jgi:hypothetical protein
MHPDSPRDRIWNCMHRLSLVLMLTCLSSCTTVGSSEYAVDNLSKNEELIKEPVNSPLNYIILYNQDGFEALVEYDIQFDENTATNGVVQKISGPYNQLVQTEKLQLSGSVSMTEPNGLAVEEAHNYTYWIEGVIEYPKDEYAHYRNKKSLKIQVKTDKTKTVGKK